MPRRKVCAAVIPDQAKLLTSGVEDDYADVQDQRTQPTQYIDTRPDGGFLNPDAARGKRKMKWTAENDRQLLLFGFGRNQSRSEFAAIAESFPEKPTAKAVEERYTKLRAQQRIVLKQSGIFDADAVYGSVAKSIPAPSERPSIKKQLVESIPALTTPTAASQPRQRSSTRRQRVESTPALSTPTAASQPDQPSTKKPRAESTPVFTTPTAASLTPAAGSQPRQQPSITKRRSRAAPSSMNNLLGQGGYHHILPGASPHTGPAFQQLQQRQFPRPPPNPFHAHAHAYSLTSDRSGIPASPYTYNLLPQASQGPQQHSSPASMSSQQMSPPAARSPSQQRDATGADACLPAEGGASEERSEDTKVAVDQTPVEEHAEGGN